MKHRDALDIIRTVARSPAFVEISCDDSSAPTKRR